MQQILTNDSEQLTAAEDGLNPIARRLGEYSLLLIRHGEVPFDSELGKALTNLFTLIIEYQATAAVSFSRRTLSRYLRNIPKVDDWTGLLQSIRDAEGHCKGLIKTLDSNDLQNKLDEQKACLEEILRQLSAFKLWDSAEDENLRRRVSEISFDDDHAAKRRKLGSKYWDSGRWLVEHDRFIDWAGTHSGCLWLRGPVGSGKTSLASIVIEHLMKDGHRVAFFYCSAKDGSSDGSKQDRAKPVNVLQNLLVQLCFFTLGSSRPNPLAQRRDQSPLTFFSRQLTIEECQEDQVQVMKSTKGPTTCVINALDEFSDDAELLECLLDMSQASKNVKFFFTSRMHVHVDDYFLETSTLSVLDEGIGHDMENYIETELADMKRLRRNVLETDLALRE